MCSRHKSKGNKALIIFAEEQKETGRTKTESEFKRVPEGLTAIDWAQLMGQRRKEKGEGVPQESWRSDKGSRNMH